MTYSEDMRKFKDSLKDKQTLVVGMARTGTAVAEFLARLGARVTATDVKAEDELGFAPQRLRSLGVEVETGGHSFGSFHRADLIIVSPGVDPAMPYLQDARKKGIPTVGEIELASWYIRSPIIAITGSNGKSTTTALIGHILSRGEKRVFVGGNIGTPLTKCLLEGYEPDYVVAEISSFQLESVCEFRPWIALLLNLVEDHLDRHASFSSYAAVKGRIFRNQAAGDWAVINTDDGAVRKLVPQIKAQVFPFGEKRNGPRGIWLEDSGIVMASSDDGVEQRISLQDVKIIGRHNVENIMAAVGAVTICGLHGEIIQEAVNDFPGLEHRLEFVGEWDDIAVYNDSKATNVSSTLTALKSFTRPVVLLAGGRDKGADFSMLRQAVKERVRDLILIGEARDKIQASLRDLVPTHLVEDMDEAIRLAWKVARRGDAIVLSPACASFDMFTDYAERGNIFKSIVIKVTGGVT